VVDRGKHLRNIAIIVVLALVVWLLPGGSTGAAVISNLLSVIFLAGLLFFGYRMYMEHRITLFDLEDRMRTLLYGAVGLLVLAIIATGRMWESGGPLILLWFAMIGAAVYGGYVVFRTSREY
jgi:FtsH-binding integral membrane protein